MQCLYLHDMIKNLEFRKSSHFKKEMVVNAVESAVKESTVYQTNFTVMMSNGGSTEIVDLYIMSPWAGTPLLGHGHIGYIVVGIIQT